MLFNSFPFICLFLPVTCLGFWGIATRSHAMGALWLVLASLAFYAWWNPAYVLLLMGSIAFNYLAVTLILQAALDGARRRKTGWLVVALLFDLGLLGYYKYAGFFMRSAAAIAGQHWDIETVVLPLGISFFTFTQIAFLVDAWRDQVKSVNPLHYALFVTYFPHLIAGPILHHREMMPQFSSRHFYCFDADSAAAGVTMFAAGLLKKVVIADSIARYSDPVFNAPPGTVYSILDGWTGALSYTLQIYFDFSGYSDMAIGLSMLFGVRIPLNFNSPYKADSIIEFWRRWHISLSNFLRDYLYIPLGGNRLGVGRRYLNLMLTMLLGGFWHGAGWTFIIWGGLQGVYLAINHAWRSFRRLATPVQSKAWRRLARLLTMIGVIVAWVFFRADSLETALAILHGMFGGNGLVLPENWAPKLGASANWLLAHGVRFDPLSLFGGRNQVLLILLFMGIALFMPNTRQLMESREMAFGEFARLAGRWKLAAWRPNLVFALIVAAVLSGGMVAMYFSSGSEFIYYNF